MREVCLMQNAPFLSSLFFLVDCPFYTTNSRGHLSMLLIVPHGVLRT